MSKITLKPTQQINEYTCGHACLAMLTGESITDLIQRFGEGNGLSVADMDLVLVEHGIFPIRIDVDGPHPFPANGFYLVTTASANLTGKLHYVIIEETGSEYIVHDPNNGREGKKWFTSEDLMNGDMAWVDVKFMDSSRLERMRNALPRHAEGGGQ